jgi:hypothetical protein
MGDPHIEAMRDSLVRSAALRRLLGCLTTGTAALLGPAPAAAQETAVLQGMVTEAGTGRLIEAATISVVGTKLEARSGADGFFTFTNAPVGRLHVRVRARGYPAVVEEVDVGAGLVFVPIFLPSAAAVLDELLVTGSRSDAKRTPQAQTAADLLSVEIPELRPGVAYVRPRGATQRLGLRGRGSFGGDGEPTIVLDGTVLKGGLDVLRQIPAAEVKSIRILKGPSAAFLYGSSEGVIYIQTESGPPPPVP